MRKQIEKRNPLRWLACQFCNAVYLLAYAFMLPSIIWKRVRHGRPFGNFAERFLGLVPVVDQSQHCVWLHAVSVGEVMLLQSLLHQLQPQHPNSIFIISTTTATGMKLARERFPDLEIFYFPIDFSWAIRNAMRRTDVDLLVLAELELWPNLIRIANQRAVPVAVINGRLGEKSFRGYLRVRPLLRSTFAGLASVLAQSKEYADRFVAMGCLAERVSVVGSIKMDGALIDPNPEKFRRLESAINLQTSEVLWVAGSTQETEEVIVARIWQTLRQQFQNTRLVIVPRHPDRAKVIEGQLRQLGIEVVRYSERNLKDEPVSANQVLIVDTIGDLQACWALADIAFVGGSFGDRGGQNMIEPAAANTAVCFGPNTWNFRQTVREMLEAEIAVRVETPQQLQEFLVRCLSDVLYRHQLASKSSAWICQQQGALPATIKSLELFFPPVQNAVCRVA